MTNERILPVTKQQYFDVIARAAFLLREFQGRQQCRDFQNYKEKQNFSTCDIQYTFDTGVFNCYGAPWVQGPLQGQNNAGQGQLLSRFYFTTPGQVLSDKNKKIVSMQMKREDVQASAMMKFLAEAAFDLGRLEETRGVRRYCQLESHFDETTRMLSIVWEKSVNFDQEDLNRHREHRKEMLLHTLQAWSKGDFPFSVELFISALLSVVLEREKTSKFGVIWERSAYTSDLNIDDETGGRKIIDPSDFITHDDGVYLMARDVLNALWGSLFNRRSTTSKSIDVNALTDLALINGYLFHQNKEDPINFHRRRIVLVTHSTDVAIAAQRGPKLLRMSLPEYVHEAYPGKSALERSNIAKELDKFFGFRIYYTNERGEEDHGVEKENRWFERFSLHYVRHLKAFSKDALKRRIQDEDKAAPDDEDDYEYAFDEIFDGLFANQAKKLKQSRPRLEQIVRFPREFASPEDFKEKVDDALGKWAILGELATNNARYANIIQDVNLKETIVDLLSTPEQDDLSDNAKSENIADLIVEYVDRARDTAVASFSNFGAGVLGDTENLQVKNPPDIRFTSLKRCQSMFTSISQTRGYVGSKDWANDFKKIPTDDCYSQNQLSDQLRDERWELHLKFLVLGAAFASAEKWSVAFSHAIRAIDIVRRAQKRAYVDPPTVRETNNGQASPSNPSGREAYYLAAVCARTRARDEDELKKAQKHLKKAIEAFNKDTEHLKICGARDQLNSTTGEHRVGRVRFENEKLLLALARYYVVREKGPNYRENPEKILTKQEKKILGTCVKRIEKVHIRSLDLFARMDAEGTDFSKTEHSLQYVAIATSLIQVATIRAFWRTGEPFHSTYAENCDPLLDKKILDLLNVRLEWAIRLLINCEKNGSLIVTDLTKIYKYSGLLILKDMGGNDRLSFDLEALIPRPSVINALFENRANLEVSKYDRWRLAKLKDFIMSRLEEDRTT